MLSWKFRTKKIIQSIKNVFVDVNFFFFSFQFWFITFTQHFSWNAMLRFWNGHKFCLSDYSFDLCFGVYFDLKCHCVENTMLFFRMDRLCFGLEWMISFDEMHLIVRSSNSCWFEHLITQFDQRHQVGVPYLCDNCENHKISTTQIVIMFFFSTYFPEDSFLFVNVSIYSMGIACTLINHFDDYRLSAANKNMFITHLHDY